MVSSVVRCNRAWCAIDVWLSSESVDVNSHSIQVARYVLGLSWVYQGFFPKVLSIAPLERALTATMGFSVAISELITQVAGVGEMIFGLLLIVFYRQKWLFQLSFFGLLGLLLYVAFKMPILLVEAFNPVTTNATMMALSYLLWHSTDSAKNKA